MTRDEHRAKCIKALNEILRLHGAHSLISSFLATDLLDSIPTAGARVTPIEATDEMIFVSRTYNLGEKERDEAALFAIMSATGDLTNPPEKKP